MQRYCRKLTNQSGRRYIVSITKKRRKIHKGKMILRRIMNCSSLIFLYEQYFKDDSQQNRILNVFQNFSSSFFLLSLSSVESTTFWFYPVFTLCSPCGILCNYVCNSVYIFYRYLVYLTYNIWNKSSLEIESRLPPDYFMSIVFVKIFLFPSPIYHDIPRFCKPLASRRLKVDISCIVNRQGLKNGEMEMHKLVTE